MSKMNCAGRYKVGKKTHTCDKTKTCIHYPLKVKGRTNVKASRKVPCEHYVDIRTFIYTT